MLTAQLDYHLPPHHIATEPANPRDAAALMLVRRDSGSVTHARVADLARLPGVLGPNDLLVFNQTRVLPAYFTGVRRGTGGQVKGLFLQAPDPSHWRVMLEARGSLRPGEAIDLSERAWLELLGPAVDAAASGGEGVGASGGSGGGGEWLAAIHSPEDTLTVLAQVGATPLPPYIRRRRRALHQPEVVPADAARYNTVYATDSGSVAAPTAGLHFTGGLLNALDDRGIQRCHLTLHVGLGTFAPVRSATLEAHAMHAEWFTVPEPTLAALRRTRAAGGRIIPIGTTTVRALESLPDPLPVTGGVSAQTRLLIAPGFRFRFTDALLTNFHLPRSTLLALVAALPGVGIERLLGWYQLAIAHDYRFYSYGDAMLIL
jgi:S-adenosylmethionine:tRNA ribosyltransferase-isomerase